MTPGPYPTASEAEEDSTAALSALDTEALTFKKDAEISRILSAFRLDAYAVLDLSPGVPDTQIKAQYRSLSLLIHPDKTTNPSAPDAFDRLKKPAATSWMRNLVHDSMNASPTHACCCFENANSQSIPRSEGFGVKPGIESRVAEEDCRGVDRCGGQETKTVESADAGGREGAEERRGGDGGEEAEEGV